MIDRREPKYDVSNGKLPALSLGHDFPFVDHEQMDFLHKHFRCSVVNLSLQNITQCECFLLSKMGLSRYVRTSER